MAVDFETLWSNYPRTNPCVDPKTGGWNLIGTSIAFVLLMACRPWIDRMETSDAANAGVITFFVVWPVLAALGALLAAR